MHTEDDFPDLDTTTASAARMYNYALGQPGRARCLHRQRPHRPASPKGQRAAR